MSIKNFIIAIPSIIFLAFSYSSQSAVSFIIKTQTVDEYPFMFVSRSSSQGIHGGGSSTKGSPIFISSNERNIAQPPFVLPIFFSSTSYDIFNPDYIPLNIWPVEGYSAIIGIKKIENIKPILINDIKHKDFKMLDAIETKKNGIIISSRPLEYWPALLKYMIEMDNNGSDIDYTSILHKSDNYLEKSFKSKDNNKKYKYNKNIQDILETLNTISLKLRNEYYKLIGINTRYFFKYPSLPSDKVITSKITDTSSIALTNKDYSYIISILNKHIKRYYSSEEERREKLTIKFKSSDEKFNIDIILLPASFYRDQISWNVTLTIDATEYFKVALPQTTRTFKGELVCNEKSGKWTWNKKITIDFQRCEIKYEPFSYYKKTNITKR